VTRPAEVRVAVPATSANLGPGFDALGLALELRDEVRVRVAADDEPTVTVDIVGEGAATLPRDASHLVVRAALAAFADLGVPAPPPVLHCTNRIPHGRGLGSSAAAVVAGVLAARALAGAVDDEPRAAALAVSTALEGHPDNAAAALLGGFTVSAVTDDTIEFLRFDAPRDLRAVLFVPDLRLSTREMRAALPAKVPLADAVANIGRVAIGVAGMAMGRFDLLRVMTVDRIHEPYRAKAYPQLPRLVDAARGAGAIGACLSGAGSTVIAFSDSVRTISRIEGAFSAAAADTDLDGRIVVVSPRNLGAHVVKQT
jgi:homoserine kinase